MKVSNGVNKKISFPIAIIIIVVCVVFVGGGILGYYRWINKEETKIPEIEIYKKRILIDQKSWDEQFYNPIDLGEKFNVDPSTTKVLYSNPMKGISFYLPYNPKWGTEKYKILPYYQVPCTLLIIGELYGENFCENRDGISFAPLAFYGTRDVPPRYIMVDYLNLMYFVPARNSEEVIAFLQSSFDPDRYRGQEPKARYFPYVLNSVKDTINDISVVRYDFTTSSGSGIPIIEVIGKKNNYLFMCDCNKEQQKITEEVIKTIKFIE